jgi:integrase
MRIRESYGLYLRHLPSGRGIYYYRTYDLRGKRTCGHSTGETTRTAAREYCNRLLREDRLLGFADPVSDRPGKAPVPRFKDFALGFWDFQTSAYLKSRRGRRPISRGYAAQGEYVVRTHLLSVFGDKRLDTITIHDVDTWLSNFTDREYGKGKDLRHYKRNTANLAFKILRIMLNYAVKQKLIETNPCLGVEVLCASDERKIEILSPEEVAKLFPIDWETVWDERVFYALNKLAACTGMRHGELLGLRGEFVYETHLDVRAQYNRYGYQDVKTHRPRCIPIPPGLWKDLEPLLRKNGGGYLFSRDGGRTPVSRKCVYRALYQALERIGIDGEERRRRNLSVHGWRHFLNTTLLMANIPDAKVMSVTGHAAKKTKERYTHFDNTKMTDVIMVQANLFSPESAAAPPCPVFLSYGTGNRGNQGEPYEPASSERGIGLGLLFSPSTLESSSISSRPRRESLSGTWTMSLM